MLAVAIGGVEMRDASVDGRRDGGDGSSGRDARSRHASQGPAAESQWGNCHCALAQWSGMAVGHQGTAPSPLLRVTPGRNSILESD